MTSSRSQPSSKPLDIGVIDHLVMAGWAGRDTEAVEAHIRELEAVGLTRPTRTPVFYRVASSLLTTRDVIEVVGEATSGEVEFVLVKLDDGLWVGLRSDHTDRSVERTSVALSKQLCAKVIAPTVWRFDDLAPHWDRITLRAWAHRGGARALYQEATLAALLPPERLIALYEHSNASFRAGAAMFGGTVSAIGGIAPAESFEMELDDTQLGRTLRHRYRIVTLPVVS